MDLKITPSGQTIVKPTALGPVANTDTELLIYGLFQKGRVLAQDGMGFREMSELTGETENALRLRKHYAMRSLRGRLESLYDEM